MNSFSTSSVFGDFASRSATKSCTAGMNSSTPVKNELAPELKKAWLEMMSGGLLSLWFAGSRK